MKTLREWIDELKEKEGIIILDADGFDRSRPNMLDMLYTEEEFLQGLRRCTVTRM